MSFEAWPTLGLVCWRLKVAQIVFLLSIVFTVKTFLVKALTLLYYFQTFSFLILTETCRFVLSRNHDTTKFHVINLYYYDINMKNCNKVIIHLALRSLQRMTKFP